jgi:hypothetical protein
MGQQHPLSGDETRALSRALPQIALLLVIVREPYSWVASPEMSSFQLGMGKLHRNCCDHILYDGKMKAHSRAIDRLRKEQQAIA